MTLNSASMPEIFKYIFKTDVEFLINLECKYSVYDILYFTDA